MSNRRRYRFIIVSSGKGGVGKSTVSANIAYALAAAGKKVGLIDLDILGSNIPKILDMKDKDVVVGRELIEPKEYEGVKIFSMANIFMDDDQPMLIKGKLRRTFVEQMVNQVNWGDIEYLIADLPPAAGDEVIELLHIFKDKIYGAIVVTTPSRVSLTDVRKTVGLCQKRDIPLLGVVNNMALFKCPHCNKDTAIFNNGDGIKKLQSDYGIKKVWNLPMDEHIETEPFVLSDYFEEIAAELSKTRWL